MPPNPLGGRNTAADAEGNISYFSQTEQFHGLR